MTIEHVILLADTILALVSATATLVLALSNRKLEKSCDCLLKQAELCKDRRK